MCQAPHPVRPWAPTCTLRLVLASRRHHGPPLAHRDRSRLLDVDVLARLASVDGLHRVPVIGRSDHDGVDVLAQTNVAIVGVRSDPGPRDRDGVGEAAGLHVAHRRNVDTPLLAESRHPLQMTAAHAADTDVGDRQSLVRPGPPLKGQHAGRDHVGSGHRRPRGSQKLAASEFARPTHDVTTFLWIK